MVENAIEIPKIHYGKLAIGAGLALIIAFLNLAQFGSIFGTYFWPFAIVWLLPSLSRYGINAFIGLFFFAIGILQDLIFGQKLGIYGAANCMSYGVLAALYIYSPINLKSPIMDSLLSALIYMVSLYFVGVFIGNIPSLIGLVIPILLTIILGIFAIPFFKILEERS